MIFDLTHKQKIQDKFAHYLKSYRRRKDLTQSELARKLDYAESHIRKFEGRQADNRMTNALEFLYNIAALEGLDLISFLSYLESRPEEGATNRTLYPWEQTVLHALQGLDLASRRRFVAGFLAKEQDMQRMSRVLRLASTMGTLSEADLSMMELLLERISHDGAREIP
jgi:transcriptional regulator with XRE-family HTH domain